ncbi:MAG: 4-hydroxy-tetrahydrodipicolinate reductase [Bacteroidales bacterium]|nr:4-hydroxy-tetrahydrodipicolinate reductase [Bacteroidales bacterium]
MNIAILGYGKMGEQVELVALERKHRVVAFIDGEEDWKKSAKAFEQADAAIDFSTPSAVLENINRCFEAHKPIVIGTTGWYGQLAEVRERCLAEGQSLFYASNFSLGVNLFFRLNRYLAKLMVPHSEYDVSMEEVHHTSKKDAPSGTAIVLANDIIAAIPHKESWINQENDNRSELSIKSQRLGSQVGTHSVVYTSPMDEIRITHQSFNRKAFAIGAVRAAEFLQGKSGCFTMEDMLEAECK